MPIEFPCPQCGQTLRTPDGTSGKQAKCPACESVAVIPASSANVPPVGNDASATSAPAASSNNPFAEGSQPLGTGGMGESTNPYASPAGVETVERPMGAGQPLTKRQIDFGAVTSATWAIFSENFGMMLLAGLIMIAIVFGVNLVSGILSGLAEFALGMGPFEPMGGGGGGLHLTLYVLVQIVTTCINLAGWSFLQCGMIVFLLDPARGREPNVNKLFSGMQYMLPVFGFNVASTILLYAPAGVVFLTVWGLGSFEGGVFAAAVFALLTALVLIMLTIATPLIVDRNQGVFEAIQTSWHYMGGNFLTTFGLYLVLGMAVGLVAIFTCGIGYLGALPFILLLQVVIYLMATGQQVYRGRLAR